MIAAWCRVKPEDVLPFRPREKTNLEAKAISAAYAASFVKN